MVEPYFRFCFEHPEEELRLYCETCGELVCVQCAVKGGKHHDHDCAVLKKPSISTRERLLHHWPMEGQVTAIEKALAQLDACCREISWEAHRKLSLALPFVSLACYASECRKSAITRLDYWTD